MTPPTMFDPIDTLRLIREMVKRSDDPELLKLILTLQREIFAVESDNLKLNTALASLKCDLASREEMHMRRPFNYYFRDGDDVPFCPVCWENERKAIHLSPPDNFDGEIRRQCRVCRRTYWEKSIGRKAKPASAG